MQNPVLWTSLVIFVQQIGRSCVNKHLEMNIQKSAKHSALHHSLNGRDIKRRSVSILNTIFYTNMKPITHLQLHFSDFPGQHHIPQGFSAGQHSFCQYNILLLLQIQGQHHTVVYNLHSSNHDQLCNQNVINHQPVEKKWQKSQTTVYCHANIDCSFK